jgi:hypothetical protein
MATLRFTLSILLSAILSAGLITAAHAQAVAAVSVDRSQILMTSKLALGCTRTEKDLDNVPCNPSAYAAASKLINSSCRYMNAHIMGWGTLSPEPSPGVYHWDELDRRMAMIRSAGAIPIITLCGAPDWMKGGAAGDTDWTKLEVAPTPEHYDDFAKLAAVVARRYPDVLYFQVWNEFKGLWDRPNNNWDYKAYTALYNDVYDALKAVNPKIKVGGPYLVIEDTFQPITARNMAVLNYWNQNKHGADFFLIDKGNIDYHDHSTYTLDQMLSFTHTFGDAVRQVKTISNLPVWYSEYYIDAPQMDSTPGTDILNASVLYNMLLAGTSVALMWQPVETGGGLEGLVTDCRTTGGGQPTQFYHSFSIFSKYFAPGTKLYKTISSSQNLEVLASKSVLFLINASSQSVTVNLGARSIPMQPYQTLLTDSYGIPILQ